MRYCQKIIAVTISSLPCARNRAYAFVLAREMMATFLKSHPSLFTSQIGNWDSLLCHNSSLVLKEKGVCDVMLLRKCMNANIIVREDKVASAINSTK